MTITHFEVHQDITPTTTSKELIKGLEKLIGGFIFWLENDEFGGRKDDTNFTGKLNQDGSITVEFDKQ